MESYSGMPCSRHSASRDSNNETSPSGAFPGANGVAISGVFATTDASAGVSPQAPPTSAQASRPTSPQAPCQPRRKGHCPASSQARLRASPRRGSPGHLRRRLARRLCRHLVSRAGKAIALRLRRRRPAVSAGVPARGPARHLPMPRRAPSRASPGTSSAPLSCRCAPHRTRPARIDRKSCVDAATGVCLK